MIGECLGVIHEGYLNYAEGLALLCFYIRSNFISFVISEELLMIIRSPFFQISFITALSSLSDRSRFKSYFRTTPSSKEFASSIVALLNNFNWTRLAFLTENQNLFKMVCSVSQFSSILGEMFEDNCLGRGIEGLIKYIHSNTQPTMSIICTVSCRCGRSTEESAGWYK